MDQDKSDTTGLTDLYLGSQHEQDVTDQLRRYNQVNRPVSRNTVCPRSQDDQEQPEDQYRPMIPGEEEIMRIYADGIYCSPDMIEKSGGFWITSSSMKPGESCSSQAALQPLRARRASRRYSGNKNSSRSISYSRTPVNPRSS